MHGGRCPLLELLILAMLIKEGDAHGYALYKRILEATQMLWNPSIGTIYRVLNDMTGRGLVAKDVEGRRHRYSVTSKGVEYFASRAQAPLTRKAGVLAAMLEAYFRVAEEEPGLITGPLKERLRILRGVLDRYGRLLE